MTSKLHPDSRLNPSQSVSNESGNESIFDVIEQRQLSRRGFLKTSAGATAGSDPSMASIVAAAAP